MIYTLFLIYKDKRMPTRLKQKDLKEGDHVYMVGIEGITSITIITPTFPGEYNLGPKFSYINHRHGAVEAFEYCKANYSNPL